MPEVSHLRTFPRLNRGYHAVFKPGKLTLGVFAPLDSYFPGEIPAMERHLERARLVDELGFSAIWVRDIPFNVPSFDDVGQLFDPFVYLGALAMQTQHIALGLGSAILPLRHPAHVAKSSMSVDVLSKGRMLLGVASGDRPEEYPALAMDFESRGERFRDSVSYINACFDKNPKLDAAQGRLNGYLDMLPKPQTGAIPLIVTGGSCQTQDWVAGHGHGWITYPRPFDVQKQMITDYRCKVAQFGDEDKPVMQSLYLNLQPEADARMRPMHLGFACGSDYLRDYLHEVEALGVNHVALNLRFNVADFEQTLRRLAEDILPEFI